MNQDFFFFNSSPTVHVNKGQHDRFATGYKLIFYANTQGAMIK